MGHHYGFDRHNKSEASVRRAIKYVREQMTEADMVALFSVTSGLQLQPFTQDKATLISALKNAGVTSSPNVFDTGLVEEYKSLAAMTNSYQPFHRRRSA